MQRIVALARITFLEGIRNRSVFGIGLFSLFILGLNVAVAGFFMREVGKVTVDMNLSAISLAGLLLVFFAGLNLMAKDIDKRTIHLVLSKPISRSEYVWGKFLGIQMFVMVSLLLLLGVSCATILLLKTMYANYFVGFSWPIFFIACFFIYLKLSLIVSIVVLFACVTTSSFVTLIFSFSVYIVGETIEEVLFYLRSAAAAENLAISDSLRSVIDVVSYLVPNFSAFDFKVEAAHGLPLEMSRLALSFGYGALYLVLLLLLASFVFNRREFN